VLVNGRIAMEGTGAELLARPEVRDAYLGGGAAPAQPPAAGPAPA
jgi:branched-chain amino acid transport system ATP-binding protein